jgi:hypothetical protein
LFFVAAIAVVSGSDRTRFEGRSLY